MQFLKILVMARNSWQNGMNEWLRFGISDRSVGNMFVSFKIAEGSRTELSVECKHILKLANDLDHFLGLKSW